MQLLLFLHCLLLLAGNWGGVSILSNYFLSYFIYIISLKSMLLLESLWLLFWSFLPLIISIIYRISFYKSLLNSISWYFRIYYSSYFIEFFAFLRKTLIYSYCYFLTLPVTFFILAFKSFRYYILVGYYPLNQGCYLSSFMAILYFGFGFSSF
jgi:hypothetical protein